MEEKKKKIAFGVLVGCLILAIVILLGIMISALKDINSDVSSSEGTSVESADNQTEEDIDNQSEEYVGGDEEFSESENPEAESMEDAEDDDYVEDSSSSEDLTSTTSSKKLRVIISSDMHCTDLQTWYEVDYRERLQFWVDSIIKEHKQSPIDLLVINGDVSLDHWAAGGSVLKYGKGTTQIFMDEYVSQLPNDISVFIIPGNHEQYSDADWYSLTGNHRQGYRVLGSNLFLFMDNYASNLNPTKHSDGTYSQTDVSYIKEMMNQYPNYNVYIIAHYFDTANESSELKKLVSENERVKALFAGHTHYSTVTNLGGEWGSKTIAQTGNFSFNDVYPTTETWGFRELVIQSDYSYSQYIQVESDVVINGSAVHFSRSTKNRVGYE